MKFNDLLYDLILEASKKEILISKVGFEPTDAEKLEKMAGGLSVWLGKKIVQKLYSQTKSRSNNVETPEQLKDEVSRLLKGGSIVGYFKNNITSIIDWYRVGLNGNIREYENLGFDELIIKSQEWHDSLDIGEGEINYVEENKLIRDYRQNGIGFYWVDLEVAKSDEECERMGHCGRTTIYNTIYSLRENKRLNEKFMLNKSHLTAAIGKNDGIIYQMKGPKNSKPNEKFHSFIKDLLINYTHIQGFGSEYNSQDDFSLTDLPEDKIKEIYDQKPNLFDNRKGKRALQKIGLIANRSTEDMVFELQIDPAYISRYVDGDWTVRKYKDANGRQRETGMFETLLSGDYWDLFDNGGDWNVALEYYIDDENKDIISDLIKGFANPDEIEDKSLKELIEEFDNNYEIRNALGNAMSSAESDSYYVYYKRTLQNALEEYGNVTKLNDEGATIEINLKTVIDKHGVDEDDLDDYFERCDDKYECVFDELMGDYYDKPNFRIDDRWTPDVNENYFNEILNDYLGDVRM